MKAIHFFMVILSFAAFTNCNNDDDCCVQIQNTTTWNLSKVEGGIAGVTQTFPMGLIQWSFNIDTNVLEIVNNNTDDSLFDFYDTGTYSYSVENNGTDDILSIDDVPFGAMSIVQSELIIDEQIGDGFVLTFAR